MGIKRRRRETAIAEGKKPLKTRGSRGSVTPAIRIRLRPGHPGSPDVLSANGSLHFGRYSEACNGRVERFLCQVQVYFRSYYSGFYHYVLAFSNDLPTLYIARPTTKRH